jgi:hypothetical protein
MVVEVRVINSDTEEMQIVYVVGEHIFSSREEAENFVQNYQGPTD